jgi:hypothetical protein
VIISQSFRIVLLYSSTYFAALVLPLLVGAFPGIVPFFAPVAEPVAEVRVEDALAALPRVVVCLRVVEGVVEGDVFFEPVADFASPFTATISGAPSVATVFFFVALEERRTVLTAASAETSGVSSADATRLRAVRRVLSCPFC